MNIYQEQMLEHAKDPHNYKEIKGATIETDDSNPSCGDSVKMYFVIKNHKVSDIGFIGEGCSVAIASASILTDFIINKGIDELAMFSEIEFFKLLGFELSPSRKRCALVSYNTFRKGIDRLSSKNGN